MRFLTYRSPNPIIPNLPSLISHYPRVNFPSIGFTRYLPQIQPSCQPSPYLQPCIISLYPMDLGSIRFVSIIPPTCLSLLARKSPQVSIRKKKEGKRKKTILHPQPSIDSPRQSTNRHPSPNGYSSKREHWCFARVHAEVSKQVGRGSVRKQMEGQRVPGGPLFATAAPSTGGDATSFPASRSRPRYRKSIRRPR